MVNYRRWHRMVLILAIVGNMYGQEEKRERLIEHKKAALESGDKKGAIKYLEKIVPLYHDAEKLKDVMLELAKLFEETGNHTKASALYTEFASLYPSCDEVEFAFYKAIVNSFALILDAEHDQTRTIETKELIEKFLERQSFAIYRSDVESMLEKCEQRLLESETNIFMFYIGRGNITAAQHRLKNIRDTYAAKKIPNIQTILSNLDKTLSEQILTITPSKDLSLISLPTPATLAVEPIANQADSAASKSISSAQQAKADSTASNSVLSAQKTIAEKP